MIYAAKSIAIIACGMLVGYVLTDIVLGLLVWVL